MVGAAGAGPDSGQGAIMAGKGATIEAGERMVTDLGATNVQAEILPPDTMPEAEPPAKEETETSRLKYLRRAALDFGQFDECAIVKVGGTRYVAAVRRGENPVLLSQPSDLYRAIYG
jgi:hypothetical protein